MKAVYYQDAKTAKRKMKLALMAGRAGNSSPKGGTGDKTCILY